MVITDDPKLFANSVNNALNNSAMDYKKLFSESEINFKSPVTYQTPTENFQKAINNLYEEMVYIPSSDKDLRDYQMLDDANYSDNIPAPDCLHGFCMMHDVYSVTDMFGFGHCMFTKPSQAINFVNYLTSVTGYKFEIALEEEIIWALRLIRLGEDFGAPVVSGCYSHKYKKGYTPDPIFTIDKKGNSEIIIYNDKYGEHINVYKTDDWNKSYIFYVVCKSDDFINKRLSILKNKK